MVIGLMGGTFNPIHYGHLMMSEYLREEMGMDKILFIPTGNPPHKTWGVLDAEDRMEMVKIAVADNPAFEVSDVEVRNKEISYSVDTVKKLQKQYPEDQLVFLVGSDILPELKTWRRFDELAKAIEFVIAVRPGYERINKEDIRIEIGALIKNYGAKITVVETPRYEISSTDLRNRLKVGKSVKYLLPDAVIKLIKEKGYYGSGY